MSKRAKSLPPSQASPGDPWQAPAIRQAIHDHAADTGRMDAFEEFDGFKNELTAIGDWRRDKTFGGMQNGPEMIVQFISGIEAENRWRGSSLGGRIVETIPDEMMREGWDLTIQPDEDDGDGDDDDGTEQAEQIDSLISDLNCDAEVNQALKYEQAYGGGAVLLGVEDGGMKLTDPLDFDRVRELKYANAFQGGWDGELIAWSYYRDPTKANYGMPEVYMLRNLGVPIASPPAPGQAFTQSMVQSNAYSPLVSWIHESRLLVFPGRAVSHRARVQMRGWGDSVFMRVNKTLSDYELTWGALTNLLTDFAQGVLKVDGLAQRIGAKDPKAQTSGMSALALKAQSIQVGRSVARMMLIDKDEEFTRDVASLAGIPEILNQLSQRVALDADMPVSLLMGQVKGGLGDSGNTDLRFFYDRIRGRMKKGVTPQRKKLVQVVMASQQGPTAGVEPKKWTLTARSLYQPTELETATMRKTVAETDAIYLDRDVTRASEVRASRYGGADWSMETVIDTDMDAEMELADMARREAENAKAAELPSFDEYLDEWTPEDREKYKAEKSGGEKGGGGPDDHSSAQEKFNHARNEYQKAMEARKEAIAEKHGVNAMNLHQHPVANKEFKKSEKPHAEKQRQLEREITRSK